MVLQARLLAFGLRSPPYRCTSVFGANPTAAVFAAGLCCTAQTALTQATSTAAAAEPPNWRSTSSSTSSSSSARRKRRTWWGTTLCSSRSGKVEPAHKEPPLPLQHQRGLFWPATGRLMSTHRPDGMEDTSGEEEEKEPEGGEDDLLSSLVEELVWKGGEEDEDYDDDDDDQEEFEAGELEGVDLESLGISMMDDESAEEVQEQLRREWGTVSVTNEQDDYQVDTAALQKKLRQAMEVLGCQSWDVGAVLTTDKEVSRLNRQYRGMTTSTDILSFPNNDMSGAPGVLPKVNFPAEMDLGDMFISLAYVDRQIKRDREEEAAAVAAAAAAQGAAAEGWGRAGEQEEEEQEWWDSERGVSGAMSRVYDVQERASMLLVHGLIHLLGYDHETEEDYEAMVAVEEEVLQAVFAKDTASTEVASPRATPKPVK